MDGFLYDNGLRHERVKRGFNCKNCFAIDTLDEVLIVRIILRWFFSELLGFLSSQHAKFDMALFGYGSSDFWRISISVMHF